MNILLAVVLLVLTLDLIILSTELFRGILTSIFQGTFYAPSRKERIQTMLELAQIKPGEKAVDLGAGDGRLVVALARAGAMAQGFEIDPWLVWQAKRNIRKAGLEKRASMSWRNFWSVDLSRFDVVTVYCLEPVMKKLEVKLRKELKPGTRVVSNYFTFPNWPPNESRGSVHLYRS